MPIYTAYGLGIDSTIELPELTAGAKQIDLTVRYGSIERKPIQTNTESFYYWRTETEIGLSWQEFATFLIRQGKEIIIELDDGVPEQDIHPALLGACMAVVLHQRSYLVLHASAVKIGDRAVAFIGDKGWGKSTMAASLVAQGNQFITDDVLAIDLKNEQPIVFPSFPQIKLCPDAVTAMGKDPEFLPRVMTQTQKRQYKPAATFSTEAVPLRSIYLLNKGESVGINKMTKSNSILPLLAHSYGARFGKKLLHLGEAQHFLQCSDLANKVGIYSLSRPSNLDLMNKIVELVQQHSLISSC